MAFQESAIKGVGNDTETGEIMSRNKYDTMARPKQSPRLIQGGSPTQPRQSNIKVGGVMGSFKKGGHVNKTGVYKLHEGEEVIPKKKAMARKMKEQYQCKSYYTKNNKLKDCTCGKCR